MMPRRSAKLRLERKGLPVPVPVLREFSRMKAAFAEAALEVIHPSGERTRISITPLPFRIGRGPDNHLILRDSRASRAHASIKSTSDGFAIEDLDSLHGTWVNGRRI